MTPITPKALSEREFTKTIRGYSTSEVDGYINRAIENYTILYRENIELAKRLNEAMARLSTLTEEEALVRQTLQTAKKAGDKIVEEAYLKADGILAAIKANCDDILRNFRTKIAAQQETQAELSQSVLTFKNELFEKYRLHIELLEQISPTYEFEEELTAEEYVDQVVAGVKKEIAAQYGISLDTIAPPKASTEQEPEEKKPAAAEEAPDKEASPSPEPASAREPEPTYIPATVPAEPHRQNPQRKRKPRTVPSVMELLDEYEDKDVLLEAKNPNPKPRRFMLDIDGQNENAELVLSGK